MKSRHMITTTPAQAEEWGVGGGVGRGEGRCKRKQKTPLKEPVSTCRIILIHWSCQELLVCMHTYICMLWERFVSHEDTVAIIRAPAASHYIPTHYLQLQGPDFITIIA